MRAPQTEAHQETIGLITGLAILGAIILVTMRVLSKDGEPRWSVVAMILGIAIVSSHRRRDDGSTSSRAPCAACRQ